MSTTPKRNEPIVGFVHTGEREASPREAWRRSEPRLPLFSVVTATEALGDEPHVVEYTMPAKANAGLALAFLRQARTIGADLAISWLIEEAIGADGYEALIGEMEAYEGDGQELLLSIGEKIQRVVMGGLEGPKA